MLMRSVALTGGVGSSLVASTHVRKSCVSQHDLTKAARFQAASPWIAEDIICT